jgi:hypothetical protein
VKFIIADIAEQCCPEELNLGVYDKESTARITERVLNQIGADKPQRHKGRKVISIIALVAAFVALMSITAYAISRYSTQVNPMKAAGTDKGYWVFVDGTGSQVEAQVSDYMSKGMYFNFSSDSVPYSVEFKPNWLPEAPGGLEFNENYFTWTNYLIDDKLVDGRESIEEMYATEGVYDAAIPYMIIVDYAYSDRALVLPGAKEIVKQETFGALELYEITCEREIPVQPESGETEYWISSENYVFLFSPNDGYLITVGGTDSMETLERIAKSLDVRVTENPIICNQSFEVDLLSIGRG